MLYTKTVEPGTLSLLKKLQEIPELAPFSLVGGTALALRYGHRTSIDIDLFGNELEKGKIVAALKNEFGTNFQYEQSPNMCAIFCFIHNIKVDIVKFNHPIIAPIETTEGISILSSLDIAAMKINAVLGRANKKDFWDIYELLHHFTLEDIIKAHQKKYPSQMLLISIPQALSYFDEAEKSEDPKCLKGYTWEEVKIGISKAVSDFLI
jgi:nucleotidyltransferase AbiEii toxin of type IV toxin-antitoxin system